MSIVHRLPFQKSVPLKILTLYTKRLYTDNSKPLKEDSKVDVTESDVIDFVLKMTDEDSMHVIIILTLLVLRLMTI